MRIYKKPFCTGISKSVFIFCYRIKTEIMLTLSIFESPSHLPKCAVRYSSHDISPFWSTSSLLMIIRMASHMYDVLCFSIHTFSSSNSTKPSLLVSTYKNYSKNNFQISEMGFSLCYFPINLIEVFLDSFHWLKVSYIYFTRLIFSYNFSIQNS